MNGNQDLIEQYLGWLVHRNKSTKTIKDYRQVLERLSAYYPDVSLSVLTLSSLEFFVYVGDRLPATVAKECAVLRGFYAYLHARGIAWGNVAADLLSPKVSNRNPKPIPDGHLYTIWCEAVVRNVDHYVGMGAFAGLRVAEIERLAHTTGLLQPERGVIVMERKGGDEATTPYEDLATAMQPLPMLRNMATVWASTLSGSLDAHNGITAAQFRSELSSICKNLEIPNYTPHQLRHTFVTNLLRAGVPLHLVSKLACHTSPTVTMRYVQAGGGELGEWLSGR